MYSYTHPYASGIKNMDALHSENIEMSKRILVNLSQNGMDLVRIVGKINVWPAFSIPIDGKELSIRMVWTSSASWGLRPAPLTSPMWGGSFFPQQKSPFLQQNQKSCTTYFGLQIYQEEIYHLGSPLQRMFWKKLPRPEEVEWSLESNDHRTEENNKSIARLRVCERWKKNLVEIRQRAVILTLVGGFVCSLKSGSLLLLFFCCCCCFLIFPGEVYFWEH